MLKKIIISFIVTSLVVSLLCVNTFACSLNNISSISSRWESDWSSSWGSNWESDLIPNLRSWKDLIPDFGSNWSNWRERLPVYTPTPTPVYTPQPNNGSNPTPSTTYDPNTDFSKKGSFSTTSMRMTNHTIYYPKDLGYNEMKHPVILWGNGTGASTSVYSGFLSHLASYGFVVVAANTTMAGSGNEMIQGIDLIISENQKSSSVFYNRINTQAIGATGHSQGGIGTVAAVAKDSRITCSMPLMGTGASAISSPILIVAGSSDTIVSPTLVKRIYSAARGPAIYAELQGASHMAAMSSTEIRHYAVAWFRLHLMNDTSLSGLFYDSDSGINTDSAWRVTSKNIPN